MLNQVDTKDRVYLVDNGSIDGSVNYITKRYPEVKVIRFETNLGFALAYNRAVALVSEEIVLFLNNDVEVDRNWLRQFKLALRKSENITIFGSKILLFNNRNIINHAGGLLTITGSGIDLDFMKIQRKSEERAHFVGCVSGASMMIPRQIFLNLGGFDPDFFAYFEDVDICWRAWLNGYKVLLLPSSHVYHKLSSTMGPRLTAERVFLGEKNRLQAMLKNLELRIVLLGAFVSGGYTIARIVLLLRIRKPAAALAILRGDWWILVHLSKMIRKRMRIQQTRQIADSYLLEHGLMARLVDGMKEFGRLNKLLTA